VLITAPILFPVAVRLGIHPVHLGILMTVNMEVGSAPACRLNCYVASASPGWASPTHNRSAALARHYAHLPHPGDLHPEMSLWLPRLLGML